MNTADNPHEVLYSLFYAINRAIRESQPDDVLFTTHELKFLQDILDNHLKDL